jgi:predicted DNA-binding WGR domain protein
MIPWFTITLFFHLFCFKSREVYHAVRFEKESRYYVIRLEKDLLEDWTITAINGRIKSKLGQSRTHAFLSYGEAMEEFCTLAKIRHQRGYWPKSFTSDSALLVHLFLFLLQIEEIPPKRKATVKKRDSSKGRTAAIQSPKTSLLQMGFDFE